MLGGGREVPFTFFIQFRQYLEVKDQELSSINQVCTRSSILLTFKQRGKLAVIHLLIELLLALSSIQPLLQKSLQDAS